MNLYKFVQAIGSMLANEEALFATPGEREGLFNSLLSLSLEKTHFVMPSDNTLVYATAAGTVDFAGADAAKIPNDPLFVRSENKHRRDVWKAFSTIIEVEDWGSIRLHPAVRHGVVELLRPHEYPDATNHPYVETEIDTILKHLGMVHSYPTNRFMEATKIIMPAYPTGVRANIEGVARSMQKFL